MLNDWQAYVSIPNLKLMNNNSSQSKLFEQL